MTLPARQTLLQTFRSDRPGVTFYSLHPRAAWAGQEFPLSLFDDAERDGQFAMQGESWEVVLWDVTFQRFPPQESWRRAVEATFDWIFASGGHVAWIGDGVNYTSPPRLFDPEEMVFSVFEARTRDGRTFGFLDLDAPAEYLDAKQLTELREASSALSAAK